MRERDNSEEAKTIISNMLNEIERLIGLKLKPDDYFTGIFAYKDNLWFNVELKDPVFASREYDMLCRYYNKYKTIEVEPNGYKRLAIEINLDKHLNK